MTALLVSSIASTLLLVVLAMLAGAWIESETAALSAARFRIRRWWWERKARRVGVR